jgi:hypothetical protein
VEANCHIWGPAAAAAGVVDRASRAMRFYLPHTLKAAFARWLDRDDDSVWIVRGLDLTLTAAVEAPPDLLAACFAQSLGQALSDALTGDGDGVDVIRFANPAAYLARYVVDVAAGTSSNRWYYRPFAGLAALSSSSAIRTALTVSPGRGLAALATLDDRSLATVASGLTERDERLIVEALMDGPESDEAPADEMFWTAWKEVERACDAGLDRGRALFAFVRSDGSLRSGAFAHALFAVHAAMSGVSRMEIANDTAIRATGSVPPSLARAISAHRRVPPRDDGSGDKVNTRFGGLLLLLRDLDTLPFASSTADWPSPRDTPPPAVLRWLTLLLCAGYRQSSTAARDGAVRALLGIPRDLEIDEILQWLRVVGHRRRRMLDAAVAYESDAAALTPADRRWLVRPGIAGRWRSTLAVAARAVLWRFSQRLPGFAESTPEHLWRNFLAFDAAIEHDDARVVVRCGQPPLHLVLTLTGMTRGLLAGCDARGRPMYLFPRE